VWVGTNDGNVQVSRDGGATWKNVVDRIQGVPKETHVSRVEPSHFDAGACYVTFDGHRTDDHKPYVFVTRDYGETWTSLASNLPRGNVNVILEDSRNRNLLFVGTEYSLFVTLDGGKTWKPFNEGLPTVRIDDIIIHPRERDLIVGTHGRSIYIVDDISPLEQMDDLTEADAHLFDVRPATAWFNDIQRQITVGGAKNFRGQNPAPGSTISYWLKGSASDVKISIADVTGREIRTIDAPKAAGLNRVQWNLQLNPPQRGGTAAPATAPGTAPSGTAPVATNPPATPPVTGRQGQGREDQPPATTQQGRGEAPAAAPQGSAEQSQAGRGGRGRGFVPTVQPGAYLVKLTVDGKVVGTKTIVVRADSLQ